MRWVKRASLLLVLLVVVAGIVWGLMPKPVEVEIEPVSRGELTVRVTDDGVTRLRDKRRMIAPVPGHVERIKLRAGDRVKVGQVLVRLTSTSSPLLDSRSRRQLQAQLQVALASVKQARAAAQQARVASDFAQRELERVRKLAASGAVSSQQVDTAQMEADARKKQAEAADLAVSVARQQVVAVQASLRGGSGNSSDVDALNLLSPISGVVLHVIYEDDGVVSPGTPLIEVGDPTNLEVVVDVLTRDGVRIRPGAQVYFDGWGGAEKLHGKVRRVEPAGFTKVSALGVSEQRVLVVIDPDTKESAWKSLGDGFRVEAHVTVWRGEHVVKLPMAALFRHKGKWSVYVVRGDKACLQSVKIGHQTGMFAEVIDGLKPGDRVIVHPGESVQDGVRVKPASQQ